MESARVARGAFSPLDEQLGLLPGHLSPKLLELVVRIAALVPFRKAAEIARFAVGTAVSEATVRRAAFRAGRAAEGEAEAERERLEREAPGSPSGPAHLMLSADGVMVPLAGGEWKEVRMLVVGELGEPKADGPGDQRIPCSRLSYFARLLPSDEFILAAYPELYRRGLENAGRVCLVGDGAEWCQSLADQYRPGARRVLDFPHAAERVAESAKLGLGEGEATRERVAAEVSALKREGPSRALALVAALAARHPGEPRLRENLEYLRKREAQMDYPGHREAGCPIGSGCVESANKLVVQARLKGPGMHWSPRHVNPMLALRCGECSGRWDETWRGASGRMQRVPKASECWQAEQRPDPAQAAPPKPPEPPPLPGPKLLPPRTGHPWRQHNEGYLSRGNAKL